MFEYHQPEEWGEESRTVWGREFQYDEERRTTCLCPQGQWISQIAGYVQTSWNMFEDGLDAISVKCSGTDSWEKSMGYYDDHDVWRNKDLWKYTNPTYGPICGLDIYINNADRYAQAFKFEYMDGFKSVTLGETNYEKYPGTWYEDPCEKMRDTTRVLVGFTITSKWTIYTFQPIWEYPKCQKRAVRIEGLPQESPRKFISDLRANTFLMTDDEWQGGSPVYKLSGEREYRLHRINTYPCSWRITGTNYRTMQDLVVMKIDTPADNFGGFCFDDISTGHLNAAQCGVGHNLEACNLRGLSVSSWDIAPLEYSKNSAMWVSPLSNNEMSWTMEIKNSRTKRKVDSESSQRKFGTKVGAEASWDVGAKVGVSVEVSAGLSNSIGHTFETASSQSEGFSRTCKSDLRSIGGQASYTIWIWEFTKTRKWGQGTDSMLSCHSWVKSGTCQGLPPNCLPPGGCVPPDCIECVSENLQLVPTDVYKRTQIAKFGAELVEQCMTMRELECDPKKRDYNCCAELVERTGRLCGLGEGGCTDSNQCQPGTGCKEQEGDNFGGPRDMPVCVTDHQSHVRIRQDTRHSTPARQAASTARQSVDPDRQGGNPARQDTSTARRGAVPAQQGAVPVVPGVPVRQAETDVAGKEKVQAPQQKAGSSVEVLAALGTGKIQIVTATRSVTEGMPGAEVDELDRTKKLKSMEEEDASFQPPPPPDNVITELPPSKQGKATGPKSPQASNQERELEERVSSPPSNTNFIFSLAAIFTILLSCQIAYRICTRKSDQVKLEFPLLEDAL